MTKPFVRDRIYIPVSKVDPLELRQHYERRIYDENECRKCSALPQRHSETCEGCPAYEGIVRLWEKVDKKSGSYFAVPSGNPKKVAENLSVNLSEMVDKRKFIPMPHKIKFTGKLYTGQIVEGRQTSNQVELIEKWMQSQTGFIEAPPRTGKTVIGVNVACTLGARTLILAAQQDWLRQFKKAFNKYTNCKAIEKKIGYNPILLLEDIRDLNQDLDKYSVIISTYQRFIHKKSAAERLAKFIKGKFSTLIVDEAHQGSATAFSKLLNRIDAKYKLALSATPDRKDNLQYIGKSILGPVRARGMITSMLPEIQLWETGFGGGKSYRAWHKMQRFLYDSESRNIQIVRRVFQDLREDPSNAVLIPVEQRKHLDVLIKLINTQAKVNNFKRNENWPTPLAIPFHANVDRKSTIKKIEHGEPRVTVAISKMVKHALDIPRWTHVYTGITPTNNGPMMYQLANRVCTWYPGKKRSVVRHMIDNIPASLFCWRGLFFNELNPKLEPSKKFGPPRYKMEPGHRERANQIARFPKAYSPRDSSKETAKPIRRF